MIIVAKNKSRNIMVHIDAAELQRICEQQLGGITIEAIVTHSNIKLIATTGEDEEVELYHLK